MGVTRIIYIWAGWGEREVSHNDDTTIYINYDTTTYVVVDHRPIAHPHIYMVLSSQRHVYMYRSIGWGFTGAGDLPEVRYQLLFIKVITLAHTFQTELPPIDWVPL